MALSGMTGFARVAGEADWGNWHWEARSVNGRGLDVRMNVPSGLEAVEQTLRKRLGAVFSRGNLQVALRIDLTGAQSISVNEDVLTTLMAAYEKTEGALATGAALATLMSIKGVVEASTVSLRDLSEHSGAVERLTESGAKLIEELAAARRVEGQALEQLLNGQLNEMDELRSQAIGFAKEQKTALAKRYRERIVELDSEGALSEERLATEVAVLAAKADVTEELDRLDAHIQRGKELMESKGSVGRDLGFLAQELNRESNTLCSKSASMDLTNIGLALKSVVDQFKEQAANVE